MAIKQQGLNCKCVLINDKYSDINNKLFNVQKLKLQMKINSIITSCVHHVYFPHLVKNIPSSRFFYFLHFKFRFRGIKTNRKDRKALRVQK